MPKCRNTQWQQWEWVIQWVPKRFVSGMLRRFIVFSTTNNRRRISATVWARPRLSLFAPTAFRESISTIREFGMGDANGGDVKQMPATFVIGADGRFRLAYYSRSVADYPAETQLVAALQ